MLDRVIRRALEDGGDFADVYLETRTARNILMEESKFRSAEFGISQGAGVRVILGDKTGYGYTDELTEDKLLRAAEVASYVARGGRAAKPVSIREERRPSFVTVRLPLEQVADEKRLDICRRADRAALAYDRRIRMASVNYYDEVRGRTIANSDGAYLTSQLPLLFFIVQALSDGNNTRHMGRERLAGTRLRDVRRGRSRQVATACAREAVLLGAKDATSGR
jgi:TldD protein